MKVGIVGLGDIAKKGYLPVLSQRENTELVLCTRNIETLHMLKGKYRIKEGYDNLDSLIGSGIEAAFISTTTDAHFETAQKLLTAGINLYIDKPISMNFEETSIIKELSEKSGKIVMVGFNRRFSPMIRALKDKGRADLIIIQKNRYKLPDNVRRFVVEDFIHVVDTLRFLMGTEVLDVKVSFSKKDNLLHNLVLQLKGEGNTSIGIMNRNSGVTEETIEYMTPENKYVVNNFAETTCYTDKTKTVTGFGDWDNTLYKRGFYQIIDHFIYCIENNKTPDPSFEDSYKTHKLCEKIVQIIGE
ncbi:MAG TPA: Gfo/Idh/MocA family oxidoreductase [Clostridiaceae bacterium]